MRTLRPTIEADINRHHELACRSAGEAMNHALQAGRLLLEVKSAVPHGGWLDWLESNVSVTPRQAQRYMQVAQGKPLPLRAIAMPKTTPVSHLPTRAELPVKAGFAAIPDHFMLVLHKGLFYCVEQSTTPGYFFVSGVQIVGANDVVVDYLTKPIRGDYVDVPLKDWGLDEPHKVAWVWGRQSQPVASALQVGGAS